MIKMTMREQNPLQFQAIRFNLPDDPPGIIRRIDQDQFLCFLIYHKPGVGLPSTIFSIFIFPINASSDQPEVRWISITLSI